MNFQAVKPQQRRAKVLLIGEAGVGKSHAALTFPNPAVIDAEGSADWFADRFKFVAVPTKSYSDVRDLVKSVREGRVKCDTLVIDSLTSIYNGLVNAATMERQRSGSDDLRPLDWGRIKRKFSSLLDELYNQLPMNVVCVGWIKPEYAKPGDKVNGKAVSANDLVKIGETFDGDRKTQYAFDFIFKIIGNDGSKTEAVVWKSRSGKLKQGQTIRDFSWKTLEALLPSGESTYRGMTDEEQEHRDEGVLDAPAAPRTPPAESPADVEARMAKGRQNIALFAKNRGISDERRHAIAAFFFDGRASTKDLDLAELQHLSRLLQAYAKAEMQNEDDDSFRSWCAYMKDLEAGA